MMQVVVPDGCAVMQSDLAHGRSEIREPPACSSD